MNPKVKKQWVKALRSGKYKQAKSALKIRSGACCCLGVLCELAVKAKVIPKPVYSNGKYIYGPTDDQSSGSLPLVVKRWAGIDHTSVKINAVSAALADHNDDYGHNFKQIATAIATQL